MKRENTDFTYSSNSLIQNKISDSIDMDNVLSVSLNIKASHAGKINSNSVFYTTRSMKKGAETLMHPFKKHLQNLHRGDAVGVINEASYIDYTDRYSEDIAKISQKIDTARNPAELVSAVKELIAHDDYNTPAFKGLGVIQVAAELYNEPLIQELSTGINKGKVSIGGNSREVYCSVCTELFSKKHKHIKGKNYNGETCFAIYDDMVLDHIGFVPDPADDKTETVIVSTISDSISDDEDATVSIEYIHIQDNIQGKVNNMNLEDLKQKLKVDSAYTVGLVTDISDVQKEALVENLTSSQKFLRGSGYLFSDEKLLPINTKENIALAILAIEQLEEGSAKKAFEELLSVQVKKHFTEDESTLALLQAFAKEEADATPVVTPGAATATAEGAESVVKASLLNISDEDLAKLVNQISTSIVESLKPTAAETQVIADSVQLDVVLNRNKQLESDIEAIDTQNNELTNKYKASIITQILLHKGLPSTDGYADVLKQRDIDALTVLLEDVQHDLARTAKQETPPAKATEQKPEEAPAVIEKIVIKDSIATAVTDVTDTDNIAISIQSVGLAKYLEHQRNKNN